MIRATLVGPLRAWTASARAGLCREAGLTGAARPLVVGFAEQDNHEDWRATLAVEPTYCEPAGLPALPGPFDLVCCAFTLAWVDDPPALLREMRWLAGPGGKVAALAEADWGGLRDHANPELAELLCVALAARGIDPLAGGRLPQWFATAGMQAQCGAIDAVDLIDIDAWWALHRSLLAEFVGERKLRVFERRDRRAAADGESDVRLPIAWALA
jgi:SAM-dependent methyltransferase